MPPPTSLVTTQFWTTRVEQMRSTAVGVVDDRKACVEAWFKSGEAVEYALKGVIHTQIGTPVWPSKSVRPDLHTHDLRKLVLIAGIDLSTAPAHIRAAWRTVFDWDRSHAYAVEKMTRREARSMFDAAFGADGVIAWLRNP